MAGPKKVKMYSVRLYQPQNALFMLLLTINSPKPYKGQYAASPKRTSATLLIWVKTLTLRAVGPSNESVRPALVKNDEGTCDSVTTLPPPPEDEEEKQHQQH